MFVKCGNDENVVDERTLCHSRDCGRRSADLQTQNMTATVDQIRNALVQLREAQQRVVRRRTTDQIITTIAATARNWLEPHNPWRSLAIQHAPAATGFSEAMVREAIDLTFGAIT